MTTRFTKISIGNKAQGLENIPGPFFALRMVFFSSYTVSGCTYQEDVRRSYKRYTAVMLRAKGLQIDNTASEGTSCG
jgi:hypothetical protein